MKQRKVRVDFVSKRIPSYYRLPSCCRVILCLWLSGMVPGMGGEAYARTLVGSQGGQAVTLQTTLLESGEYVSASGLVDFFPNRWQYDPLSGTLNFTRGDGNPIGMKVGDPRILVGRRIVHTGRSLLRRDGQVYIPFSIVNEYLFPQSQFRETVAEPTVPPAASPSPEPLSSATTAPTPGLPPAALPLGTPAPAASAAPAESGASPFGIIILDPGNDPSNPGVTGPNGIRETDLNLLLCEKIAVVLRQSKNYKVLFTRERKREELLSDDERAAFANQNNGTLFISIHCGSLVTNEISRGTLYYMNEYLDSRLPREQEKLVSQYGLTAWHDAYKQHTPESLRLARDVLQQLDRYYKVSGVIQLDSDPRPGRFSALRGLAMPGVIVELGNFSHPATNRFLSSERNQNDIANYLAIAVNNYLVERTGVTQAARTP